MTNLEMSAPVRPRNIGRGEDDPSTLPQKIVVRRFAALASISDTQNANSCPVLDTTGLPTSGMPIKASGVKTVAAIVARDSFRVAAVQLQPKERSKSASLPQHTRRVCSLHSADSL